MEFFEVGGCVRDEIMGVKSKDIDFTVVLNDGDFPDAALSVGAETEPYAIMVNRLVSMGVKVIRDNDGVPIGADFLTVRGIAPSNFPVHPNRALDFVLARKESDYADGRRPDKVEVGTLMDDLARRDFTMNAIAKATDGSLIDPFGGQRDISMGIISAVGNATDRFREDALRAVRALRFMVTKNMTVDPGVRFAMQNVAVLDSIVNNISDERIKDELSKMFRHNTVLSLVKMSEFPALTNAIFSGSVSLDATMKTKGTSKAKPEQGKPKLPPAKNGCTCFCHTTKGVMHMVACC